MFDEMSDNNQVLGRLATSIKEMKAVPIKSDVLLRAENVILNRAQGRRNFPLRTMFWLAGAAVAATAAMLMIAPSKSFAAELTLIAHNGDMSVRHIRYYEVQPNGSLKLALQEYSDGTRERFIDTDGNQYVSVHGLITQLHTDGSVTVEQLAQNKPRPMTASQFVSQFVTRDHMSGVTTSVKRGIQWHGRTVDEYVAEGTMVFKPYASRHMRMTLIADTNGERPLEIEGETTGLPPTIAKWDYPVPDPRLFELPSYDPARVYNLDTERKAILEALSKPGQRVKLGTKTVELIQLWVDESGNACAIAHADYAYPSNNGIHIDNLKLSTEPEKAPPNRYYPVIQPTEYNGHLVQLFFTARMHNLGPVAFNDKVTVRIPVFEDKSLIGYAKFTDIPVHRAGNLSQLLRPLNQPFWLK